MYSDLIAIEITEQLAVDLNLSVCNRLRNKTKKPASADRVVKLFR